MKFEIKNTFSGAVIFTAEIDCKEDAEYSVKLGLAVKLAVKEGANLARANLADANLADAYLAGAYLAGANLARANLAGANLARANLAGAYLAGANLARANLARANLADANLADAKGLKNQPEHTIILPEGELIVYKKLCEGVAKLRIPIGAKRSNASGRKCRAEYAEVLELPEGVIIGHSNHDKKFAYEAGKIVKADNWCDNWAEECAGGIHFFITRQEAEDY